MGTRTQKCTYMHRFGIAKSEDDTSLIQAAHPAQSHQLSFTKFGSISQLSEQSQTGIAVELAVSVLVEVVRVDVVLAAVVLEEVVRVDAVLVAVVLDELV